MGFHLSVPMGYVGNAPLFFMATKTATDLINASQDHQHTAAPHLLEHIMSMKLLPDDKVAAGML